LSKALATRIKEKKSKDLTLEMIQSRFQTTELATIKEMDKKKNESRKDGELTKSNEDGDDEENDSDYMPELEI
jgi:hypothetical protein